ncbi:alpha/beta fold hydrolase [Hyphococcus sp.]|jgi:pimeloyl-ACP methyl ester carboxylesterase|uniref:alpha/beta fold hydrolase n=1 Tax=Hyphococcus sp. TaxID=2038636 RepID=UPI003D11E796
MRMVLLIVLFLLAALTGLAGCAAWSVQKGAPSIGKFIDVEGERLHVVDMGPKDSAKPPLILIHGASVNLRDMKLALGDRLAADHRVILIDRPGRGYSTRPDDGWRLETQARLIKGAVDALGADNPVVVGQSFGGAVALRYALEYQNDMSGLVLLAPVSHQWPGGVAWYNNVSGWPVAGFFLRRLVIPVYGQLSAQSGIKDSFAPDTPPDNYFEESGLSLLFRPHDFKANAADIANLKSEIIAQQSRYATLKLPVAVVTGTSDSTVSPHIHSKQLAQDIEGASLTLLPHTGHALHHSQTEAIIKIIRMMTERA